MLKPIRFPLIIGFLALLGACSGNPVENRLAPDPSLSSSPQTEPSPNNSPTTNQLPENFPTEIPKYLGAELLSVNQNPDNNSVQTRWQSSDPSNLIEAFYQQELATNNWQILTPFSADSGNNSLTARREDLELTVAIVSTSPNTEFSLDYRQESTPQTSPTPTPTPSPSPVSSQTPNNFSDLESIPVSSRSGIQDLARLGVLTANPPTSDRFEPNKPISRRDFARWLVQANNAIFASVPGKQIRLGENSSSPVFGDVKASDPDYAYIQGLAEAGLLPSRLSGDSSALLFRPNALLTREDLIAWKVPLDIRKALPTATLDTIKNTWGFQDTAKINPKAARSLYADFQNGDSANIRRIFGYTTLFQPKKSVTRAEAAAALGYFGFQGDGLSAADALQAQGTEQSSP